MSHKILLRHLSTVHQREKKKKKILQINILPATLNQVALHHSQAWNQMCV